MLKGVLQQTEQWNVDRRLLVGVVKERRKGFLEGRFCKNLEKERVGGGRVQNVVSRVNRHNKWASS